jgi:hypothetical protein
MIELSLPVPGRLLKSTKNHLNVENLILFFLLFYFFNHTLTDKLQHYRYNQRASDVVQVQFTFRFIENVSA